jgi:hypothetical protein
MAYFLPSLWQKRFFLLLNLKSFNELLFCYEENECFLLVHSDESLEYTLDKIDKITRPQTDRFKLKFS